MDKRISIIGGGASGLFAACLFAKRIREGNGGVSVTILEKTDTLGNKLLLTGHGRCNLTNNKVVKQLKDGYHEAAGFIYSALNYFGPEDMIRFFEEELDCPLKEEENNRVFPQTDDANTILEAMLKYIDGYVNVVTGFECADIVKNSDASFTLRSSVGRTMNFDTIILATGGASFPKTGSSGTAYMLASIIGGHTCTPLRAGLSSVTASEADQKLTASLTGVSVNADTSLWYDRKKQAVSSGDVLFTHKGLSGPAVTELCREIPSDIAQRDGWIELDFVSHLTDSELDKELCQLIDTKPDTKLINLCSNYVPQSLAEKIVERGPRADVTELYARNVRADDRKNCVKNLKHLDIHIDEAPSLQNAYVTRGGINLKEVRRENMKSKKCDDLYIIGEMLDIDGISGGYNLQACMSEAAVAVRDILD